MRKHSLGACVERGDLQDGQRGRACGFAATYVVVSGLMQTEATPVNGSSVLPATAAMSAGCRRERGVVLYSYEYIGGYLMQEEESNAILV